MPRRGQEAVTPEADIEPEPLPLEQVRRTPGASMAPQLSMTAPSGEQPAFGGGVAPPPAGSDGGGLFGLAARTPKFEPELASQSQSLFLPKRKRGAEPEPAADEPDAPAPAPATAAAQADPAPAPAPERAPERPEPEPQMPPLPERPAARHQSGEHAAFVEPAPQMARPAPEATHEAMPPIEPRQPQHRPQHQPQSQPEPARPDEALRQDQDNTQVAMSPRFDAVEEAPGGTRPRDEFEQFAPPQPEHDAAAPAAGYDDRSDQAQQPPTYGDPAYAPLAPQLEPDQGTWSQGFDQPYDRPYDQPHDQGYEQGYEQGYDQSYDQSYEPSFGAQQDRPEEQFGPAYDDPYGQSIYADATLVGQPPVGGPTTPTPPPMAPQGYDPYGNAYDARYEPQRGQGGAGKPGGRDLKRWGLIVVVIAVVVAIIAFVIGLINNSDDANAKTGTTQGATTTEGGATAEAEKIDTLIKTSAKDKAAIGAAQADLEACENIDEAIKTFEDAAASRKRLASEVAKVDTAVLPGSRKLVKNLETAWLTAQNADLAFAAWGEKRKLDDEGKCVGGKGKLKKATTLSLASHDPKKAAAKAWGPIAEEYGFESIEWRKL